MNERTNERTNALLYKNMYLSHFILERVDVSVMCERWVETHTQREDFFFLHLLPGARGCQRLHPLASRDTSVPHSTAILCPCLNLTAWLSSRDPLPVTHLFGVTGNEPKIQMICYITIASLNYKFSI